jgi:site-specific DNA-methyltransferase (adenine-specific)
LSYRIIHSDAFEWLERRRPQTIHAVITDPPFSTIEYRPDQLEKRKNGNGGIWRLPPAYDGHARSPLPRFTVLDDADRESVKTFHQRLAPLLLKVLVPGGHVAMASQNLLSHIVTQAFHDAGFEVRGQIARITKTMRGGDRPKGAHRRYRGISVNPRCCWEPWLLFRKPCAGRVRDNLRVWGTGGLRRPSNGVPFSDLIESGRASKVERAFAAHPSLKPQHFMRQIVRAGLPLGRGIVLDPFMGSGATIAAAQALGFRSIGLEVSPDYFAMAEKAIPRLAAKP